MAYRFLDPNPVYFKTDATAFAANGTLTFYDQGTATPKNTFNSEALTTANPNPVPLDAAGRANVNVWLSGDYTVVLKDSLGATVWTRDVIDVDAGGTTIPALETGKYLTNDGINLDWQTVREVPDPTGSANKILSTDGANLLWVNQQSIPEPDISNTSTSLTIGDGTIRYRILTGTATGVNAGGRLQTVSVTFPSAFTQTPIFVGVTLNNSAALSGFSNQPSARVSSKSTTGFTAVWTMGELDDSQSGFNFNAAVTFEYVAIGQVAA